MGRPLQVVSIGGSSVSLREGCLQTYLQERRQAGVWNARVLMRELRERGYSGGYTILTDYLHPQRKAARQTAVRRFETGSSVQAQVDWGHLGNGGPGAARESSSFFYFLPAPYK